MEYTYESTIHRIGAFLSLLKLPQQYGCPFPSDSKVSRCLGAWPAVADRADHAGQYIVGHGRLTSREQEGGCPNSIVPD